VLRAPNGDAAVDGADKDSEDAPEGVVVDVHVEVTVLRANRGVELAGPLARSVFALPLPFTAK
jgi:hypothetical protein